ncbi:hypothetical protein GY14_30200 [Delftia tsuruhatensis]|nr:hypothetical protein GY14_30200 [Delftia tsuruhatensis]
MTALTQDRNTLSRNGEQAEPPVAANARIFAGALVAINAAGLAVPGSTALGLKGAGVAERRADNTGGTSGAIRVRLSRRPAQFANSAAADAITLADLGADCFIVDDQTVAKTDGTGTRSRAGRVYDVDADGVWVDFR